MRRCALITEITDALDELPQDRGDYDDMTEEEVAEAVETAEVVRDAED